MGDSWEYDVLWEYAGLTPPDFHEDEIQSIINTLDAIQSAIGVGSGGVWGELQSLQASGISSAAFDALYDRWDKKGAKVLNDMLQTVNKFSSVLSEVVIDIDQWKILFVEVMGGADIGLTALYVGTGGLAALADHLESGVIQAELKRRLEGLVNDLEAKLVAVVIDSTPLSRLKTLVTDELQNIVNEVIDDAGVAAGNYARSS